MGKLDDLGNAKPLLTAAKLQGFLGKPASPCSECGSPSLHLLQTGYLVCPYCHPLHGRQLVAYAVQLVVDDAGTPRLMEAGKALREANRNSDTDALEVFGLWRQKAEEFDRLPIPGRILLFQGQGKTPSAAKPKAKARRKKIPRFTPLFGEVVTAR